MAGKDPRQMARYISSRALRRLDRRRRETGLGSGITDDGFEHRRSARDAKAHEIDDAHAAGQRFETSFHRLELLDRSAKKALLCAPAPQPF